jgi:outer membrane lipoprotein-sorting protein
MLKISVFSIAYIMNAITRRVNCFLFYVLLLLLATPAFAQVNHAPAGNQLKNFTNSLAQVNIAFTFPEGFKEIKAPNTDAFPFDYAMELPDADFEVWMRINTQKENEKFLADKNIHIATDSLYKSLAKDQITAFTSENSYLKRRLPTYILERYNADAGSTYLLNLDDSPITKHYKYALLVVLQKNGAGTIMAICFTNEKGPEFFKNMNLASNCLKFK